MIPAKLISSSKKYTNVNLGNVGIQRDKPKVSHFQLS